MCCVTIVHGGHFHTFSKIWTDSSKISDDSPNIIARRFYERIKMFPELFLRDSNISEPCRRPQRRDFPNDYIELTRPNTVFARDFADAIQRSHKDC